MKLFYILVLSALFSSQLHSQSTSLSVINSFKSDSHSNGIALDIVSSDSLSMYVLYSADAEMDIDPSVYDILPGDGLTLTKYDFQRRLKWSARFGNGGSSNKIYADTINNFVYYYGTFNNTFDANPGDSVQSITGTGQKSSFIIKLTSSGQFVWVKTLLSSTASGQVQINDMHVTPNGEIFLYGFQNQCSFYADPNANSMQFQSTNGKLFLIKWDANANYLGGGNFASAASRACNLQLNDSSLYISGVIVGQNDLDLTASSAIIGQQSGASSSFVAKYSLNFNFLNSAVFNFSGGSASSNSPTIKLNQSNQLVVCGYVQGGTLDANPGPGVFAFNFPNGNSIYIIKLDSVLNFLDATSIYNYASYAFAFKEVHLDISDNIFIIGSLNDATDFDPGPGTTILNTANGVADQNFIAKFNASLIFVHANMIQHGAAYSYMVLDVNDTRVSISGNFAGTMDTDLSSNIETIISTGSGPVPYFVEYNQCAPIEVVLFDTICTGASYLLGDTELVESGKYEYRFPIANGCDSIVELNLHVKKFNTNVNVANSTFFAENNNYSNYQWFNSTTNTVVNGAISNSFAPPSNDEYQLIISDNICNDTSQTIRITNGQNFDTPELEWYGIIEQMDQTVPYNMQIDSDQNLYISGTFVQLVDFDTSQDNKNLYAHNGNDNCIAKYDKDGNFIWATTILNASSSFIEVDESQNVYFALKLFGQGTITNDADPNEQNVINPLANTQMGNAVFLLGKLNPNGQLLWLKGIGNSNSNGELYGFELDSKKNMVIYGNNSSSIDFDPSASSFDVVGGGFIAKYDSLANLLGVIHLDQCTIGSCETVINSAKFDKDDNLIIGGQLETTVDLDPGPGSFLITLINGQTKNFIAKYDSTLNFIWGNQVFVNAGGYVGDPPLTSLDSDAEGNVYFLGYGSLSNVFGYRIRKYSPLGQLVLTYPLLDQNSAYNSIRVDPFQNVYLTGWSANNATLQFNQNTNYTFPASGYFVLKYSKDASQHWFAPILFGSVFTSNILSAVSTHHNEFYLFGSSYNPQNLDLDLGPGITNVPIEGSFLAKYQFGCTTINTSVTTSSNTMTLAPNMFYEFYNCVDNSFAGSGFQNTFTPCTTGNYYAVISQGNCSDTTNCAFLTGLPLGPIVISASQSTVCPGENVLISASSPQSCNLNYQWFINGSAIPGFVSSNFDYIMPFNVSAATVQCMVIDPTSGNSVYSNVLTIVQSSVITDLDILSSTGNCPNDMVEITTSNPSNCNQIYQWFVNDSLVTGEVNPIYSHPLSLNQDSVYCIITNPQNNTTVQTEVISLVANAVYETTLTINSCGNYTSPSGSVWTSNGIYYDSLISVNGCDSITLTNLTITTIDAILQSNSNSLFTNQTNATFQWLDCNLNQIIQGQTSSIYLPSQNGTYALIINLNGCIDTTNCIVWNGLGFEGNNLSLPIKIYPNPTYDYLQIDFGGYNENCVLTIFDKCGKIVVHQELKNPAVQEIELFGSPGVYTLQIEFENGSKFRERIIKM